MTKSIQNCVVGKSYPSPLTCDFQNTGKLCSPVAMNFGVIDECIFCNNTD